ncbi:putative reverse transcriptase domain-containing protein [Tanacetum coccineum]
MLLLSNHTKECNGWTIFKIENILEDLRWHVTRRITDGVLRHPADSQAWRTIDEKFPKIAEDTRNLRLGISADGVDVNTGNRHHSQSYVGDRRYLPYNHPFRKQKKAFNGQQEFLQALIPMTGEQIYNEVKHIENKWGKGKRTNNNASENQEDTRGRGGKIQKQKRNTTKEEGSSSQTKERLNARLDLTELGVKPELFAMQDEDKTTLPPAGYTLTNAKKDIFCETLHNIKVPEGYCSNFSSLVNLKDRKLIGLKSHETSMLWQEFCQLQSVHFMHHHSICYYQVERELAIDKESVLETVRWISYGPRVTVVKYDAYNINGYTFRTKYHDGKVYQNSGVSVEAIDLHISKEVATTRQAYYYGVLQEIWVLDYHFRQIPLFKYDWVNHKSVV